MLKKILIIVAVLVLLFVGVMAALPGQLAVRSALDIKAENAQVLAYVSDLKTWPEWWTIWNSESSAKPEIEFQFSEKTEGVGSTMSWEHKTGKGKITITKIDPRLGVFYDLEFGGTPPSECQLGIIQKDRGVLSLSLSLQGDVPLLARLFTSATEAEMSRRFDTSLKQLAARFDVEK